MKRTILTIALILLVIAMDLGENALFVLAICWGLKAIGIYTIFGWTVGFSWPLVILFTIAYTILKNLLTNK
jgi:hypothetical protein